MLKPQTSSAAISRLSADGLIGGFFFFLCAGLSVAVLAQVGVLVFYQNFSPEVIYAACGLGFKHPAEIPMSLQSFLLVQKSTFDCSLLDHKEELLPAGLFSRLQLYLSYAILSFWRPPLLSYFDLWPLTAIMGGAYASGAYLLFRHFLPRLPAILGGFLVTLSPLALTMAVSLRDYSKAPFFIWAIVFLICAIRATTLSRACLSAFAAGVVTGVGYGFRADLVVLIPAGLVALLVVTRWSDLRLRLPAMIILAATSISCAWPILGASAGSSYGSVIMQGMSDPYLRFLGLDRSQYSLGARYSDELVLSSIAATERPENPNWDESEAKPLYGISQSMKLSGQNAATWMPLFVGDLATQGLKSLAWLTGMPALVANSRPGDPGFGGLIRTDATFLGGLVYAALGHPWLIPLGLAGMVAFAWREFALRPRYFAATGVLIGLLAASTVAQFAMRHVFHLEFLWILSILSLGMAIRDNRTLRPATKPVAIGVAGLAVVGATMYAGTLFYQQSALRNAISAVLSLPRESIYLGTAETGPRLAPNLIIEIPTPDFHTQILQAPDDSMNKDIPLIGLQWDVRAEADRLVLSLMDCPAQNYMVAMEYEKSPSVWQPFDETIPVSVQQPRGTTRLLVSAFYRPTQYLSKLSITPWPDDCLVSLERIDGNSVLPHLFTAVLPPDWENIRWHRNLGGFGAP